MEEFKTLLKMAGLTKAELARRLDLTPRGISRWKNAPPGYAVAYLKLLIEYNRLLPSPT